MTDKFRRKEKRRRRRQRIAGLLACTVVFSTVYIAAVPTVTMAKEDDALECPASVPQYTDESVYDDDFFAGENPETEENKAEEKETDEKEPEEKETEEKEAGEEEPEEKETEEKEAGEEEPEEKETEEKEVGEEEPEENEAESEKSQETDEQEEADTEDTLFDDTEEDEEPSEIILTDSSGNALVTAEGTLPDGVSLCVTEIAGEEKSELAACISKTLAEEEQINNIYPYDISFEKEGEGIEPDDLISATITFREPIRGQNGAVWALFHVPKDSGAEKIADAEIETNKEDSVTEICFQSNTFSPYVLAELGTVGEAENETAEELDLNEHLKAHNKDDSKDYVSVKTDVDSNGVGRVTLRINSPKGIAPGNYYYQLPLLEGLKIIEADQAEKKLYKPGETEVIGVRTVDADGMMHFTFYDIAAVHELVNYVYDISCSMENKEELIDVNVEKEGEFDSTDGMFHWTITAAIPAYDGGNAKQWYLYDRAVVGMETLFPDLSQASVSIQYGQNDVPHRLKSAAEETEQEIAYWWDENVTPKRLYLVQRCTDDACRNKISAEGWGKDWCREWRVTRNIILTIEYKDVESAEWFQKYPGDSYMNRVYLQSLDLDGNSDRTVTGNASVMVPMMVSKKASNGLSADNNYSGLYTITVNSSKIDLFGEKASIAVTDVMENLAYVPGTMSIRAVDPEGSEYSLIYGEDYTVTFKPEETSGTLTIELLRPEEESRRRCTYTIQYRAQVLGFQENGGAVSTTNAVSIMVPGSSDPDSQVSSVVRKTYTISEHLNYNIFSVRMIKTDEKTQKPLAGAVYGLRTADGYRMTDGTTDENGEYTFRSDTSKGIVLNSGIVYYLQEEKAPPGYNLSDEKHWFYFSKSKNEEFEEKYEGIQWIEIPENGEATGTIRLTDSPGYVLPETGGTGTMPFTVTGLLLLSASLYGYCKSNKKWIRKGK